MTHPEWGEKWAAVPASPGRVLTGPHGGGTAGPKAPRRPARGAAVRRRRRRPALRALLLTLLAVVLVLAGLLAWVAADALRARSALESAAAQIGPLQKAAVAGDQAAIETRLATVRTQAARASDATDGRHWALAARLPVVGADVAAVSTLADVVHELANGPLTDLAGITQLANPATFAPRDGRVDLAPLAAVRDDVVAADSSVEASLDRVDGLQGGVLPQVDDAVARVAKALGGLRTSTATAARAAQLLPPMLGQDGPRDYLVLVQSSSEQRALGGIPGAVLHLRTDQGRVELVESVAGGPLGGYDEPVLPLDPVETATFGTELGRWMQDVTMTPDFPRAAELASEMWRLRTGQRVDGVLTADPVVLQRLLEGRGPVTTPSSGTHAEDEIAAYLLNGIYLQEPDPARQDAIFGEIAQAAFATLSQGADTAASSSTLLGALVTSAREGRVLVWSADAEEERLLHGTVLGGELSGARGESPVVGVFLQATDAAKIGYYLDSAVEVDDLGTRPDGSRKLEVTVDLHSTVNPEEVPGMPPYVIGANQDEPGIIRVNSLVYAPAGGRIEKAVENGEDTGIFLQQHHGLALAGKSLAVAPGEHATVTYVIITGKSQPGPVVVRTTPGPRKTQLILSQGTVRTE